MIMFEIDSEAFVFALWYNGYEDEFQQWLDLKPNNDKRITCPYFDDKDYDGSLIQTMWMYCVIKYGDYGTSPRYGWIEEIDNFKNFVKQLIENIKKGDE